METDVAEQSQLTESQLHRSIQELTLNSPIAPRISKKKKPASRQSIMIPRKLDLSDNQEDTLIITTRLIGRALKKISQPLNNPDSSTK